MQVESLRVQSFVASLPPKEETDITLSILNSKKHALTRFVLARVTHVLKCCSMLDTRSNDFICMYIERVTSRKWKNCFVSPL